MKQAFLDAVLEKDYWKFSANIAALDTVMQELDIQALFQEESPSHQTVIEDILANANIRVIHYLAEQGVLTKDNIPNLEELLQKQDEKGNTFAHRIAPDLFKKMEGYNTDVVTAILINNIADVDSYLDIQNNQGETFEDIHKKYNVLDEFNNGVGKITPDGLLLSLAAKKERRENKGQIFEGYWIQSDQYESFLENAIELTKLQPDVPVTFVVYDGKHSFYGMIERSGEHNDHVDVVLVDSLAKYGVCAAAIDDSRDVCRRATDVKSFDVVMNFDRLQGKGQGCTIFSLIGCSELSNLMLDNRLPAHPTEENYASVADYMRRSPAGESDLSVYKGELLEQMEQSMQSAKENGVVMGKLPLRVVRSMQSLSRIESRFQEQPEEAAHQHNAKTPRGVVDANTQTYQAEGDKIIRVNRRLQNKLQTLHDNNKAFIEEHTREDIKTLMEEHTLEGIQKHVAECMEKVSDKENMVDARPNSESRSFVQRIQAERNPVALALSEETSQKTSRDQVEEALKNVVADAVEAIADDLSQQDKGLRLEQRRQKKASLMGDTQLIETVKVLTIGSFNEQQENLEFLQTGKMRFHSEQRLQEQVKEQYLSQSKGTQLV